MIGNDPAGEIVVRLDVRDGRVHAVDIESTRPQLADRLLAGTHAEEAMALLPRLYAICGNAQQIAGRLALAAARGEAAAADAARTRRVEAEIAQEYLWRVLIDWTRAAGPAPDPTLLAAARSALAHDDRELLQTIVERHVLGADSRAWYEHEHVPAFEIWIAQRMTAAARFLGDVQRDGPRHGAADVPLLAPAGEADNARRLAAQLDADADFEHLPHDGGRPAETGAIARMRVHPLVASMSAAFGRSTLVRFAARMTELARICCGDVSPAPLAGALALGDGRGLGWVETARGLLMHAIALDGETIERYRIVAPTEWNFHPQGVVPAALLGVHELSAADLRRRAEWLLQSLDPCVAHRLEIAHA